MTEAEALQQLTEQNAEVVKAIKGLLGVLAISWVGRYFCYGLLNGRIHRAASTKPSVSSSALPSSRSSSTDGPLFVPVQWTSDSACSGDSSSSDGGSCGGSE